VAFDLRSGTGIGRGLGIFCLSEIARAFAFSEGGESIASKILSANYSKASKTPN